MHTHRNFAHKILCIDNPGGQTRNPRGEKYLFVCFFVLPATIYWLFIEHHKILLAGDEQAVLIGGIFPIIL